ncbi:hypothetical protein MYX77_01130 [Acidobacteriia bacterium AH_259_A11_L15]|nr:hypothetical protein [Acidobacteriia bacterium AH_259_A11_L15]
MVGFDDRLVLSLEKGLLRLGRFGCHVGVIGFCIEAGKTSNARIVDYPADLVRVPRKAGPATMPYFVEILGDLAATPSHLDIMVEDYSHALGLCLIHYPRLSDRNQFTSPLVCGVLIKTILRD